MTPGQIAHDAGRFERKWEHMGESQKADWERIAQSVIPRSEPMTEKEIAEEEYNEDYREYADEAMDGRSAVTGY